MFPSPALQSDAVK